MRILNRCSHTNVRCIHGQEIESTTRWRLWRRSTIARVRCLDCEKPLYDREMPDLCSATNKSHGFVRRLFK